MTDSELRVGDCLSLTGLLTLPDHGVDVVITDPPYSEHVHAKGRRTKGGARQLGFEPVADAMRRAASGEFARLAKRWVLVFCDVESAHLWRRSLTEAGLEYVRTCFWHKLHAQPQLSGDRPGSAAEAIVCAHPPGKKHWNGGGRSNVYSHPVIIEGISSEPRVHETQKPLALMQDLVSDFSDEGELVLDAFAGSGTTGVACRLLGRDFLGWEVDAKVAAVARARLDSAAELRIDVNRDQLGLFAGAPRE